MCYKLTYIARSIFICNLYHLTYSNKFLHSSSLENVFLLKVCLIKIWPFHLANQQTKTTNQQNSRICQIEIQWFKILCVGSCRNTRFMCMFAVSCFMCCQHAGVGRRLNIRMTSRQPHEQTYRFTFLCARAKRKRGETFFF